MTSKQGILNFFSRAFRKPKPVAEPEALVLTEEVPDYGRNPLMAISMHIAKYQIGQIVQHRNFPFRGIIFDVDPQFANTEEWYDSIPEEVRPHKNQPYYHLFAENERTHYVAYVSEQNLVPDDSEAPLNHPDIPDMFIVTDDGQYELKKTVAN